MSIDDILRKHNKVFSGIGKVHKECKITLQEDSEHIIMAARTIPIVSKNKVNEKLDNMVAENIIIPVSEPGFNR